MIITVSYILVFYSIIIIIIIIIVIIYMYQPEIPRKKSFQKCS